MSGESNRRIACPARRLFLKKGIAFGTALTFGGGLFSLPENTSAFTISVIAMQMQQEQLITMLYWANKTGRIKLKNKVIVIPRSGILENTYGIVTRWDPTPEGGITAHHKNVLENTYGIVTRWDPTPEGGITAHYKNVLENTYGIVTRWDPTPEGGITANDNVWENTYGIITKILTIPVNEFQKNPDKYHNL